MESATTATTRRQLPLDEVEWQLLRIFEEVLEAPRLGATADFFVAGGDSLAAARVFTAIAERLHVDLPLTTLIDAPTARKLARKVRHARRLRAGNAPPVDRPLVPLAPAGAPLFFAPSAGADTFTLHELAKALAPRVRLIGLSYPGLDRTRPFLTRVEDLAERFLPHVRTAAPDGPLRFAGSSFGGLVAVELAKRLRAEGRRVDLLTLLDTYAPHYPRRRPGVRAAFGAARRHLMPPLRMDEPFTRELIGEGMRMKRRALAMRLRLRMNKNFLLPRRGERFLYLLEACMIARERYAVREYGGDVLLFRASTQPRPDVYFADPTLGWGEVVRGKLEVVEYGGAHADHLRAPAAESIADQIAARCVAADR